MDNAKQPSRRNGSKANNPNRVCIALPGLLAVLLPEIAVDFNICLECGSEK